MDTTRPPLSDAEREVLKILWERGPASARRVLETLRDKGNTWAYTTLATLLQRLETKGYVSIDKSEAAHVFKALATREDLIQDHLKDLADEYCEGTPAPLMLALVRNHRFTPEEIARFRGLLDELEKPAVESAPKRPRKR